MSNPSPRPHSARLWLWLLLLLIVGAGAVIAMRLPPEQLFVKRSPGSPAVVRTPARENPPGAARADLALRTRDMLNAAHLARSATGTEREAALTALTAIAQERRGLMLQAMRENPADAHSLALPEAARAQLPEAILSLVEERRALRGPLEWAYADDFDNDRYEEIFTVEDEATDERIRLFFADDRRPATLPENARVHVQVVALEDTAVAASMEDMDIIASDTAAAPQDVRKIAIFLVNFSTDPAKKPFTVQQVRDAYFTGSSSARKWYQEVSFGKEDLQGKTNVDGDIFGYYTLDFDGYSYASNGTRSCNTNRMLTDAKALAVAEGVDLAGYHHMAVIFPSLSCGWSGLGTLNSNPGNSWMNGTISQRVIIHELGHNHFLHHAASYTCTENGTRVAISSEANCTNSEYGDPFNVMGGSTRHFHAQHKGTTAVTFALAPKYLLPENTVTLTPTPNTESTHVIAPLERASTGVQALRIVYGKPHTSRTQFYYIDFRQPFGIDNYSASDPAVNGVMIRIADDYTAAFKTYLIDTTPQTSGFGDAALAVGKTFTDPLRDIAITTLGIAPEGATVKVVFGPNASGPVCKRAAPTLSFSPSTVEMVPGASEKFTLTIRPNDSGECGSSTYKITYAIPSGFTATTTSASVTLAPGYSTSTSVVVTAGTAVAEGTYTLTATSKHGDAGAEVQGSTSATIKIGSGTVEPPPPPPPPPADTTPPVVTISKPKNGSKVAARGNLGISAAASDASGIASITLLLDGATVKTCVNTTKCSVNVPVSSISAGGHTVSATATDLAGNASAPVSVTVTK